MSDLRSPGLSKTTQAPSHWALRLLLILPVASSTEMKTAVHSCLAAADSFLQNVLWSECEMSP